MTITYKVNEIMMAERIWCARWAVRERQGDGAKVLEEWLPEDAAGPAPCWLVGNAPQLLSNAIPRREGKRGTTSWVSFPKCRGV